ncbi:MAG: DUF1622 domain-containing protein [Spirochaetaceae bacterium]|nr:DUF1622 domain-containing protein [Spirochaetaceae bacterium]
MEIFVYIEMVISIISVAVVIYGVLISLIAFVKTEFLRIKGKYSILRVRVIRADLGTYLLLSLELLIAADVIKTILEPGIQELIVLAGVVLLRTILSFFLNKEIQEIDKERIEHPESFTEI